MGKDSIKSGIVNVFTGLIDRNNSKPGDYYDDEGFLMCGNCKTRKQTEVNLDFLGQGIKKVGCVCTCEKEKMEREERMAKESERLNRIKALKEQGIADPQYLQACIEKDDRSNLKISNAILRYTDKWKEMKDKNMGILFYGDVGRGKTFYAACIANRLLEKGIPVIMTNIPALITAMTKDFESEKAKILGKISSIDLLVLDDLGVERETTYSAEKIQEIIDTRYRSGKPLIVTTNLTPDELKNPTELRYKRVYDRVLEMCFPIHVEGGSRRQEKAQNKREQFKNLILE